MSSTIEELEAALATAVEPIGQVDALVALATAYMDRDPGQGLIHAEKICDVATAHNYKEGLAAGLHLKMAGYFRLSDFERSREAVGQAITLFAELGNAKGEGICRTNLGLLDCSTGDYSAAIEQHSRALDIFQSIGDRLNEAVAYNNLGIAFYYLGNLDTALEYHLNSLAIREEIADFPRIASSLGNIGTVYDQRGDLADALEYFFRSLEISRELDDLWVSMEAYSNIGSVYQKMGEYEKALEYNNLCLSVSRNVGSREGEAEALNGLGNNYVGLKQYDIAQEHYLQSFVISSALGLKEVQATTLLALGSAAKACGAAAQAFEYSSRALAIGKEIHSRKIVFEAHLIQAHCCKMAGDYEMAFFHLEQFQIAKEEMYNEESDRKFNNLRLQYEVQRTKNEAEIYRLKNVELAAANDQLRILNEEKNEFLGIAAHDLKNPLSTILMISHMLETDAELLSEANVREFARDIKISSNRMFELITNLLDIHAIEHHGARVEQDVVDMTGALRSILASFRARADQKQIALHEELALGLSATADAGAVAQVFENLLSNALKFSPSGSGVWLVARYSGENGNLVEGRADEADYVRVEVRDEGPGLSESDKQKLFKKFARLSAQPTGGEHSTGLGLSIVKRLVEAMGGRIWCESEPSKGAAFIVELPAVRVEKESLQPHDA